MTGSLADFIYTDDNSTNWGVTLDEEWGKNGVSGFVEPPAGTALTPLPRGWEMRYAYAVAVVNNFQVRRKFNFGKAAATGWKAGKTFTHKGLGWTVQQTTFGEKRVQKYRKTTGQDIG